MATATTKYEDGILVAGPEINLEKSNVIVVTGKSENQYFRIDTGKMSDKITIGSTTATGRVYAITSDAGNDTITVKAGSSADMITSTGGNNTITINGDVSTEIKAGGGNDKLTITAGANKVGMINLASGNNTVSITDRKVADINTTSGNDKVTLSGMSKAGTINTGTGKDNITIKAGSEVDTVRTTGGTNTITVGGTAKNIYSIGNGNDKITVQSTGVVGTIDVDGGTNTLSISGVVDRINTHGTGKSTITVNNNATAIKRIGLESLAEGGKKNTLKINGREVQNIVAGVGDDVITTTGQFDTITTGVGKNTVTVDFKVDQDFTIDTTGSKNSAIIIKNARSTDFALRSIIKNGVKVGVELYGEGKSIKLIGDIISDNATTIKFADTVKTFMFYAERADGTYIGTAKADKLNVVATDKVVNTGAGNDVVNINGYSGAAALAVNLQGGKNTVNIGAESQNIEIYTGTASDKIIAKQSSGITVNGSTKTGSNKDTVSLTDVKNATVTTQGGKDVVTLTNVEGATVMTGAGADSITVKNSSDVVIEGGAGADIITVDWLTSNNITIRLGGDALDTIKFKNIKFADLSVSYGKNDTLVLKDAAGNRLYLEGWRNVWPADDTSRKVKKVISFADGSKTWEQINLKIDDVTPVITPVDPNYVITGTSTNGDDNITISNSSGEVVHSLFAGAGNDTINITGGTKLIVNGGEGNDTFIIKSGHTAAASLTKANNIVYGDNGDDTFIIDGDNYNLNGGAGNDTFDLKTNSKNNRINMGDGDDVITVKTSETAVNNIVNGGAGNDTFNIINSNGEGCEYNGEAGNDIFNVNMTKNCTIDGGAGNNTMEINVAKDCIIKGSDLDADKDVISITSADHCNVIAGAGADTISVIGNKTMQSDFNVIDGGNGDDTIVLESQYPEEDTAPGYLVNNNVVYGGYGKDIIEVKGCSNENYINGGAGDDVITTSSHSNKKSVLAGGSGNDTIIASALTGSQIYGGSGADRIELGVKGTHNFVYGDSGDDVIKVQGTYNTVVGGAGKDKIIVEKKDYLTYTLVEAGNDNDTIIVNGKDNVYIKTAEIVHEDYDPMPCLCSFDATDVIIMLSYKNQSLDIKYVNRDTSYQNFDCTAVSINGVIISNLRTANVKLAVGSVDNPQIVGDVSSLDKLEAYRVENGGSFTQGSLYAAMKNFGVYDSDSPANVDVATLGNTLEDICPGVKNELLKVASGGY